MTKKNVVLFFGIVVIGALAGCAQPPDPATLAAAQQQVTCSSKSDCDALWSRAVVWVTQNAPYKIQTESSNLIETMGPLPDSPDSEIVITRLVNPDGSGSLQFQSGCDNIIGCVPSGVQLEASFNDFVLDKN